MSRLARENPDQDWAQSLPGQREHFASMADEIRQAEKDGAARQDAEAKAAGLGPMPAPVRDDEEEDPDGPMP